MWRVDPPPHQADYVARECVATIRDRNLRRRVKDGESDLLNNSRILTKAASDETTWRLFPNHFSDLELRPEQWKWLYERMLRSKRGRAVYDELLVRPSPNRCPYCGFGYISTIDHYLPKDSYYQLSIEPLNLIPCCADCNHKKSNEQASGPGSQYLHPYFVEESFQWLVCKIDPNSPPAMSFEVACHNTSISSVLRERLQHQFQALKLNERFIVQAGPLLNQLSVQLKRNFKNVPTSAVSDWLSEQAETWRESDPNSIGGALCTGLARSRWYCDGGYLGYPW